MYFLQRSGEFFFPDTDDRGPGGPNHPTPYKSGAKIQTYGAKIQMCGAKIQIHSAKTQISGAEIQIFDPKFK